MIVLFIFPTVRFIIVLESPAEGAGPTLMTLTTWVVRQVGVAAGPAVKDSEFVQRFNYADAHSNHWQMGIYKCTLSIVSLAISHIETIILTYNINLGCIINKFACLSPLFIISSHAQCALCATAVCCTYFILSFICVSVLLSSIFLMTMDSLPAVCRKSAVNARLSGPP